MRVLSRALRWRRTWTRPHRRQPIAWGRLPAGFLLCNQKDGCSARSVAQSDRIRLKWPWPVKRRRAMLIKTISPRTTKGRRQEREGSHSGRAPNLMNRIIRSALLAASMLSVPVSAMAKLMSTFPFFGNWAGGAFDDDQSGKFVRCVASVGYHSWQGDVVMAVAMERHKGWSIGFANQEWNLQPRIQIPLSISFDGQNPWSGSAIALDSHMVTIPMAMDSHLMALFRASYQMIISAEGKAYPFNLDGTSRLMVTLSQCVDTQLAIERGEPPPRIAPPVTAPVNPLPPPSPPPQAPQYELIAMRLASNLLLETKLPSAHLLAASETPPQIRGRGVVWTSQGGIGAVTIFPATSGKDAQQVTTALITNDATACKGDFVSGRASELVDNTIVARSTTECRDSAGLHMHRYFTIPAAAGGDFIVFEVDHNGTDKPVPAPGSPLSDAQFQAAAVNAAYAK